MRIYLVEDKLTGKYYQIKGLDLIVATSRKMAKKKVVRRHKVNPKRLDVHYLASYDVRKKRRKK